MKSGSPGPDSSIIGEIYVYNPIFNDGESIDGSHFIYKQGAVSHVQDHNNVFEVKGASSPFI